jgi:hypothetical protein
MTVVKVRRSIQCRSDGWFGCFDFGSCFIDHLFKQNPPQSVVAAAIVTETDSNASSDDKDNVL